MTLSYDKHADVLYVTFECAPDQPYIYVENANGDVLRIDKETNRVVGVTIPFFLKRAARGRIEVPEIGSVPLNDIALQMVCL
jgi:uncharacterized protein YuzE